MKQSRPAAGSEDLEHVLKPAAIDSFLVITGLVLAIFMLDTLMPLGIGVWVLYLIPIALSIRKRWNPLIVSGICVLLVVIGFFLSPPGLWKVALFNRAVMILA